MVGILIVHFCRKNGLNHSLLVKWKQNRNKIENRSLKYFKNGCGLKPKYSDIEQELFYKIISSCFNGFKFY